MLRPPNPSLLKDTVAVYALIEGLNPEGGPSESDGAMLASLPAAVQQAGGSGPDEHHGGIQNTTDWNILFASDPSVTLEGQLLLWTHRAGQAFDPPIALRSLGSATPPGGLMARWTVAARETS